MSRFSGDCVDVKMLPQEWWHRMIDVCGVGVFERRVARDVFITHLDPDHLPLREYVAGSRLTFLSAPKLVDELARKYRGFEVIEYRDVLELEHTTLSSGRHVLKTAYAYFIEDCVVIPECDDPDELICEYKAKLHFLFVSHQSHHHPVSFNNNRRDVFILDNRVWKPYAPNIIPKIVFSSTRDDEELFKSYFQKPCSLV